MLYPDTHHIASSDFYVAFFFFNYEIFRHPLIGEQECPHPKHSDPPNRTLTPGKIKIAKPWHSVLGNENAKKTSSLKGFFETLIVLKCHPYQ